jgi:hypothetical protein
MSDEFQVFRGDRPTEEAESPLQAPAKPKAATVISKNNLPAAEPVGDLPEAVGAEKRIAVSIPEIEPGPANFETEPEPPYNFEIDPDSLWRMPEAMQERLSNLNSTVAVIHQQLDDQERDTARIAKALRALR